MSSVPPDRYPQDYRHFDNLIWQVPTWASAIFALTIVATSGVLANVKFIDQNLKIDPLRSLAVFLFAVVAVLMLLANVLIRFRLHQSALGLSHTDVPLLWWQPKGGASLLLIIFIEVSVLVAFALVLIGCPTAVGGFISGLLLLLIFPLIEWSVRRAGKRESSSASAESAGG